MGTTTVSGVSVSVSAPEGVGIRRESPADRYLYILQGRDYMRRDGEEDRKWKVFNVPSSEGIPAALKIGQDSAYNYAFNRNVSAKTWSRIPKMVKEVVKRMQLGEVELDTKRKVEQTVRQRFALLGQNIPEETVNMAVSDATSLAVLLMQKDKLFAKRKRVWREFHRVMQEADMIWAAGKARFALVEGEHVCYGIAN